MMALLSLVVLNFVFLGFGGISGMVAWLFWVGAKECVFQVSIAAYIE